MSIPLGLRVTDTGVPSPQDHGCCSQALNQDRMGLMWAKPRGSRFSQPCWFPQAGSRQGLGTEGAGALMETSQRQQGLWGLLEDQVSQPGDGRTCDQRHRPQPRPGSRRGQLCSLCSGSSAVPAGPRGLGSHDELWLLGEVGPRRGVSAQKQGRTRRRGQAQCSGIHRLSQQAPWRRRLSKSLDLWLKSQEAEVGGGPPAG